MTLKAHRQRHKRSGRKSGPDANASSVEQWPDSWEATIESLAMTLCPVAEWQVYEKQLQYLAWKTNKRQNKVVVRVFPIWRKYRQRATRVATLYNAMPLLRHLPLRFVGFLGDLLVK